MWLILIIWIIVIFATTLLISQYVKMQKRADIAIAFYILFITMSQILAAKIGDFSIGTFQITAPVAVLIFPFTFQITDMVNEFFGRKETHRMILIAFITQILMSVFLWFSIDILPASFWGFDYGSSPTEMQSFWTLFFGSTIRITLASWISFIITENLDALVYSKIRDLTKGKNLWIRNVLSDIPMLALDSVIFVTIAFYGVLPIWEIIIGQILTKWFFGIIDTPFMYLSRYIVDGKINLLGNLFEKKQTKQTI
ncbi:MAG: queuosine precursor transporter [Candidatus Lokiarchaeota archaeon]|nr:queuosine precursor transporter [Candidatus Lokiarchaeota archaeon]MBD3201601.1 queuosine precursor transporter [Candidatus Lokiarchaeota archaeon]